MDERSLPSDPKIERWIIGIAIGIGVAIGIGIAIAAGNRIARIR